MRESTKWWIVAVIMLVIGIWQQPAHAGDIYKCKDPRGVTVFQQTPCPPASKPLAHTTFHAEPDAPSPAQQSYGAAAGTTSTVLPGQLHNEVQPREPNVAAETRCEGIGCTAHQRGEVKSTRCVAPDGKVYYVIGACRRRSTYVGSTPRQWHNDHVQGMPDAVMVGPDTALNPRSGQTFQLEHAPTATPVYQHTQDQSTGVDADTACRGARLQVKLHPGDAHTAKRAHDVCNAGRGLWDQPSPARGVH